MSDIVLYGDADCFKTNYYREALKERNLDYEFADVRRDPRAAERLAALTGSASHFPTFEIKGRKLRNPTLEDLEKHLARASLFDAGLIHDEKTQRFVRRMSPSDAFVSYRLQGTKMILTHIEVDESLRGTGLGAAFAREVLEKAAALEHGVSVACPYLRRIAASREDWRRRFGLGE